jgi:hypothetical protein
MGDSSTDAVNSSFSSLAVNTGIVRLALGARTSPGRVRTPTNADDGVADAVMATWTLPSPVETSTDAEACPPVAPTAAPATRPTVACAAAWDAVAEALTATTGPADTDAVAAAGCADTDAPAMAPTRTEAVAA